MKPVLIMYNGLPAIVVSDGVQEGTVHLNVFTKHGVQLEHNVDISDCPVICAFAPSEVNPSTPEPEPARTYFSG